MEKMFCPNCGEELTSLGYNYDTANCEYYCEDCDETFTDADALTEEQAMRMLDEDEDGRYTEILDEDEDGFTSDNLDAVIEAAMDDYEEGGYCTIEIRDNTTGDIVWTTDDSDDDSEEEECAEYSEEDYEEYSKTTINYSNYE